MTRTVNCVVLGREAEGLEALANPRNATAGAIRLLDSKAAADMMSTVIAAIATDIALGERISSMKAGGTGFVSTSAA